MCSAAIAAPLDYHSPIAARVAPADYDLPISLGDPFPAASGTPTPVCRSLEWNWQPGVGCTDWVPVFRLPPDLLKQLKVRPPKDLKPLPR